MNPSPRVHCDAIAHLYDTQPYRAKTVDPEHLVLLRQPGSSDALSILDIACGTGNQLVANRTLVPHAQLVGLDRSLGMLRAAFRVLRRRGRVALRNLCPQECADWLYYAYFPEAYANDLEDFWLPEAVVGMMEATGFVAVTVERQHLHYEQNLRVWLDTGRRRDTCSQLLTIPDAAYEAGVRRLEHQLADGNAPLVRADYLCFVTIRGEKQTGTA